MQQQTAVFIGNLLLLVGIIPLVTLGVDQVHIIEPIQVPLLHSILLVISGISVITAGIISDHAASRLGSVMSLLMIGEIVGAVALQRGLEGVYWSDMALILHFVLAVWLFVLSIPSKTVPDTLLSSQY